MRTVLGEDVLPNDVIRPLAPGERLLVKSDVANEIEGVEILAQFLGDRIEGQALGFSFVDDCLLAFGVFPALEEVVETGKTLLQGVLGVVAQINQPRNKMTARQAR